MPSEKQIVVETANITTNTAENTTTERRQTEISELPVPAKQLQQTSVVSKATTNTINTINNNNSANGKSKIKFVVGTEESRENNYLTSENIIDSKGRVESYTDTKSCSNPAEEVSKVAGEKKITQQSQKQNIEDNKEGVKEYINNTNNNTNTKEIPAEPQLPPQQVQQPTPKEEKVHVTNSTEPSKLMTMTSMEAHQAAPVVTNATVTVPTQRQTTPAPSAKQPTKFILRDSPDSSPVASPSDGIPYINSSVLSNSGQNPIQPNHILDSCNMFPPTPDDSTTSDPLNYIHQPRFPSSSNGISRTQQKLLLQRQHFLADDENYLIHPRNQLRLTKVIERINREHAAILLYRDPIIESLQRVWPKYVQDHPEVLDDDFGVGYEDSKEWGVISDHGKSEDHIRPNSIISTETLGIDSMPLRGIK